MKRLKRLRITALIYLTLFVLATVGVWAIPIFMGV